GVFAEPASLMSGVTRTVRVGANLHIAVADATSADPLLPGRIYAYNLAFGPHGSEGFTPGEGLRSLELLRDHFAEEPPAPTEPPAGDPPPAAPFVPPRLALGYESNLLPTFVLPPDDLAALRLVH